MRVLVGFRVWCGRGGLRGGAWGVAPLAAPGAGALWAPLGWFVASRFFALRRRAEGAEPTALAELVGRRARVSVSIAPAAPGAITLIYDGAVQTLPASANAAIERGHEVEILAVRGVSGVLVRSLPPP